MQTSKNAMTLREPDSSGRTSSTEPVVKVDRLCKTYGASAKSTTGGVGAVNGIDLEIQKGEFFVLLGPSGCGKTTTLRSIAGLETPTSGEIALAGQTVYSSARRVNVPVQQRDIGMVFQSYAIWPHMTVFENVAFPLRVGSRRQRMKKAAIRERVHRALSIVELDGYGERPATNLSGGQQQRLALARALAAEPAILLLDEPLSNLDAKLRTAMRLELRNLQRELRFTSIYVTHDQVEALALATRVAIIDKGQIQQIGKPREVYEEPANKFVANFIGESNFLRGTVAAPSGNGYEVATAAGPVRGFGTRGLSAGSSVTVGIRPEHLHILTSDSDPRAAHAWRGTVTAREFLGDSIEYRVSVADCVLKVKANPSINVSTGTEVLVAPSRERVRVFED